MAPKKLTDCPENLREAIDWLIHVRHGGDNKGLERLSEALEKLIQKSIEEVEESVRKKIELIKTIVDDHSRAASVQKEIHEEQKVIGKLKEVSKNLDPKKDLENNILHKLCLGLENFLGYKAGNYTGDGIVYGDCDRLRDAILLFLYGVLESVKEDSSVAAYYHISKNALNNLYNFLYKGRDKFSHALIYIGSMLNEYDLALQRKTDAVKIPLNTLKRQIENHMEIIEKEYDDAISDQINSWALRVKGYILQAEQAEKAIEQIDSGLSCKVQCHLKSVLQAVKTFEREVGNYDLNEIHKVSFETMMGMLAQVEKNFRDSIEKLQNYLNKRIKALTDKLERFQNVQFSNLAESVAALLPALNPVQDGIASFEHKYKNDIVSPLVNLTNVSTEFQKKFNKTKNAIEKTIGGVVSEIESLKELKQVFNAHMPFLITFNGGLDPFKQLKEHFKSLGSQVIGTLTIATDNIGKILEALISEPSDTNVFKQKHEQINQVNQAIQKLIVMSVDLNNFKIGDKPINIPFDGLNDLKGLSDEIGQVSSAATKILEPLNSIDASALLLAFKTILSTLTAIPQAITKHSNEVVTEVMNAIKEKVTLDVSSAAGTISEKLKKIEQAIKNKTEGEKADYGEYAAGLSNVAAGLQRLVTEFGTDIETKLRNLEGQVGKDDMSGMYARLKNIRENIEILGDKVNTVRNNTIKAGDELAKCITQSNDLLIKVPRWAGIIIDELQKDTSAHITQGFRNVQNKAKTLYVERKKTEFLELDKIVKTQVENINKAINIDLVTNVKGLMRQLQGKLNLQLGKKIPGVKTSVTLLEAFKIDSSLKESEKFATLSDILKLYLDGILDYIISDVKRIFPDASALPGKNITMKHDIPEVENVKRAANYLLDDFINDTYKSYNFDHVFNKDLDVLRNSLISLSPDKFGAAPYLNLDALKGGLTKFCDELEKAYISTYSGTTIEWQNKNSQMAEDSEMCARIFLTTIAIMSDDFKRLRKVCGGNSSTEQINLKIGNALGDFFSQGGYKVASSNDRQDGELQNRASMTSQKINETLLNKTIRTGQMRLTINMDSRNGEIPFVELFDFLKDTLHNYYRACHYTVHDAPKPPCNVYQMLQWTAGIPYNRISDHVNDYFKELFERPSNNIVNPKHSDYKIESTINFNAQHLVFGLQNVSEHSEKTLIAILGHGHVGGIYACDFNTNPDGLLYPTDMNILICMLLDILKRLHNQLYFLLQQCQHSSKLSGWRDCYYGKGVGGSHWHCNLFKCPKADCRINCNGHPSCGLKSPLQSFLEDGLPGFLPHQLDGSSGKLNCPVKNHLSVPCKTPMGFTSISHMASHTQTGMYLRNILADFCGTADSPLSKLCAQLSCLLPTAPQTLGDILGFLEQFLMNWNANAEHRRNAFNSQVASVSFGFFGNLDECSTLFGSPKHFPYHNRGDVYSVFSPDDGCYRANKSCGAYIKSLNTDTYGIIASKNAPTYLSWIVYITETFFYLLHQLKQMCNENCGTDKKRCRIIGCLRDACSSTKSSNVEILRHSESCNSILNCNSTHMTLYACGLTFGNRRHINGSFGDNDVPKRTCRDFIDQLHIVCSDGSVLSQLVHETIPNFLWKIRQPFACTVLALWSLSLFYLLYVLIGRLDTLHIRSHLRASASYKIAAQSLLAAARVGKLSKISYLQA